MVSLTRWVGPAVNRFDKWLIGLTSGQFDQCSLMLTSGQTGYKGSNGGDSGGHTGGMGTSGQTGRRRSRVEEASGVVTERRVGRLGLTSGHERGRKWGEMVKGGRGRTGGELVTRGEVVKRAKWSKGRSGHPGR